MEDHSVEVARALRKKRHCKPWLEVKEPECEFDVILCYPAREHNAFVTVMELEVHKACQAFLNPVQTYANFYIFMQNMFRDARD